MKKILSALLAVAMMTCLLAGCSGTGSSAAPAQQSGASVSAEGEPLTGTLTVWSHQNPAWNEDHQAKMDEFMKMNPGVTIKYETFPYMDFMQKTQTSLLTDGAGADIYEIWGGWALSYAPTGVLAKVPDNLTANLKEDCYAPALGSFTVDGAYYGIPLEYNIEYGGMLVNKTLFDEKGLTYPTTWAELEKIADETSVRKGDIMEMRGFEFCTGDGATNMFLAMILSNGGTYLTDDGYKVDFSSPQAVEAMKKMVEYVKDRGWTSLEGLNMTTASDPGGSGEVFKDACMMAMVGPYGASMGPDFGKTYGVDYEYVPMPPYGEKNAFASETGWGLAVAEKSKQKELAWKYIEWFAQPENMMSHNIACAQIPAYKSISANPAYLEKLPYVKPILDILGDGQFMGYINSGTLKSNIADALTKLVTSDISVEDALKVVQDNVNAAKI